jgi:hypothetical protein
MVILKQCVNEGCDCSAGSKNNYQSKKQQNNYQGQKPEFLPYFKKLPEFF